MSTTLLARARPDFANAEAATEATINVVLGADAAKTSPLRQLRARRDRLLLASLSTDGINVPDCARPASLAAGGPLTAGLDFEREFAVPGNAHG